MSAWPVTISAFPLNIQGFASLLKASGYRTALMGKRRLGSLPEFGLLKSGYNEFCGFRGGAPDYFSHKGFMQICRDKV